jgi:hypothetical protein
VRSIHAVQPETARSFPCCYLLDLQARASRESLESRVAALEAIVAANMSAAAPAGSNAAAVPEDTPLDVNGNGS